jgi:hypothetical protein
VYFVNFVVKFLLDFLMVWGDGTRTLVSATRRGRRQMPGSRAGWLRGQRESVTTRSGWLAICAKPVSASPVPGNIGPETFPRMLKWHKMVSKSCRFVPLFAIRRGPQAGHGDIGRMHMRLGSHTGELESGLACFCDASRCATRAATASVKLSVDSGPPRSRVRAPSRSKSPIPHVPGAVAIAEHG